MNYITWEEVQGIYGTMARDKQAEITSNWIPGACAYIDGVAGTKYTVPFTPTPYLIKDIAIDLVYWKMTLRQDGADKLKKWIDERLEGLVNGTLTLTDPGTGVPLVNGTVQVALTTSGTLSSFGMGRVENFGVDRDWAASFDNPGRRDWDCP